MIASIREGLGGGGGEAGDGSCDYYQDDPKKWLRAYFDREGGDLNYDVEQDGPGHARVYTCTIQLPIEGGNGEPVVASASVQGKRKQSLEDAARAACRMLHGRGVLRNEDAAVTHRGERKAKLKRGGDGDSDDDTFFDRTGQVEEKRKRRAEKKNRKAETFESLTEKRGVVLTRIAELKVKLTAVSAAKAAAAAAGAGGTEIDPLDAFMSGLSARC
jgi:hypothetical protein